MVCLIDWTFSEHQHIDLLLVYIQALFMRVNPDPAIPVCPPWICQGWDTGHKGRSSLVPGKGTRWILLLTLCFLQWEENQNYSALYSKLSQQNITVNILHLQDLSSEAPYTYCYKFLEPGLRRDLYLQKLGTYLKDFQSLHCYILLQKREEHESPPILNSSNLLLPSPNHQGFWIS